MKTMTFLIGMMIAAGPVMAQETAAPPAPMPAPSEKPKKICRRIVATGSIMPRSMCMTKPEWQQVDATNAANADMIQRRRNASATGRNGSL